MKRLVFFYGTKDKDSKRAYDFLPESHFIRFDSPDAEKYINTIRDKIFDETQALGKNEEARTKNWLYMESIKCRKNQS